MVKKTLKQKIKRVCWWTSGLTILYFLVGAWLVSDGTRFDPIKTYNLLKDTLTLTATFLAPVAAFVLFSDWREQHKNVKNEIISEEIIKILKKDLMKYYTMTPIDLQDTNYQKECALSFHQLVADLTNKVNMIHVVDEESGQFKNITISLGGDLFGLWDTLMMQSFAASQYEEIKDFLDKYSSDRKIILTEMQDKSATENQNYYLSITGKIKELKPLSVR